MSQLEGDLPEDAIRLFKKTIDIDPKNLMAYNLLGKSYGRKKMYDQEAAIYKKAIGIEPNFALAHFNLGIVLGIQKKFESAAPHFLKAIELDKQYEKPFVIQMLTALGKYDPTAGKPINQPKSVKQPESALEIAKDLHGDDHVIVDRINVRKAADAGIQLKEKYEQTEVFI